MWWSVPAQEIRAIGVTTGVEVFNDIMDTFCPAYEADPATLSENARIQILRAIGVAIVKHGSSESETPVVQFHLTVVLW